MKFPSLLVTAGLLAMTPLAAHAKIERVVEKTFAVQPGGVLRIETQGGDVRVSTSADATVKVTARQRIRASNDADADEILKKLTLDIAQSPEGVSASAKYEKKMVGFHWGSWPPVQVDFTVTVPVNYHVELKTSGGDITVGNLNGKVYARTSGGDITLGKITGDIDGGTSGGNVRLEEGSAEVKLGTSGGDIRVGRAVGPTDLGTSGGNTDDMIESLDMMTSGKLHPEMMITHVGGLNAVAHTTIELDKIPGGKKLIYTHKKLDLVAINDFAERGKTDPLYKKLAELVAKNNMLWSGEAEKYLLEHAPSI